MGFFHLKKPTSMSLPQVVLLRRRGRAVRRHGHGGPEARQRPMLVVAGDHDQALPGPGETYTPRGPRGNNPVEKWLKIQQHDVFKLPKIGLTKEKPWVLNGFKMCWSATNLEERILPTLKLGNFTAHPRNIGVVVLFIQANIWVWTSWWQNVAVGQWDNRLSADPFALK